MLTQQVLNAELLKPGEVSRQAAVARKRVAGGRDKDIMARLAAFTSKLRWVRHALLIHVRNHTFSSLTNAAERTAVSEGTMASFEGHHIVGTTLEHCMACCV